MMGAVLEEELTRIAALVTTPEGTSGGLRARPRNGVPTPGGDRLDELARWWSGAAGIGGVGSKQMPQRVEHFWLPHTGAAGPVRSEVVLHRFTAPRDPEDALDWGIATADDAVDDGTDLLLLSIPVPPDEVTWQVAAAQVLGLDAVEAAGWPGPELSDHEWIARVTRIRDGLKLVHGDRKDLYRLLHLLEHRELLAGTGLLLQAAARRTPAILDGPVATTCALLAARLAPASRSWFLAADSGRAVLVRRMLEELRLTAIADLGLDEGDGVGARFALQLLETALLRAQDRGPEEDGGPEEAAADAAQLDGAAEAVAVVEVDDLDDLETDSVVFEPVPVDDADFEVEGFGPSAERDQPGAGSEASSAAATGSPVKADPNVNVEPGEDLGGRPGNGPATGGQPDGRS
jgi:hypothetical protein